MYQDGVAKLIDFGIAKLSRHSTRGTSVQGTYSWMSPEQALSGEKKTYTMCDMFSFGLIVKWLLVGLRDDVPFKGMPTDHIITEHRSLLASAGSRAHHYVEDLSFVPPMFRVLIQSCTATDSSKRWTAPKAMLELCHINWQLFAANPVQTIPISGVLSSIELQGRHRQPSPPPPAQAADVRQVLNSPQLPAAPGIAAIIKIEDCSSILNEFEEFLRPNRVAFIKYTRNMAFAATICDEYSSSLEQSFEDAACYAAASKILHSIAASNIDCSKQLNRDDYILSAEALSSKLAQARLAVSQIDKIHSLAMDSNNHAKAADLQQFRLRILGCATDAENVLNEKPTWPRAMLLQAFSLPLHRLTTSGTLFRSKKWIERIFVLEQARLYYSDGTNGFPSSRQGTIAFMRSSPSPSRRYCLDLAGCRVVPCVASVDGQAFAFEIKFPPRPGHLRNAPKDVFLAAADESTRQRCISIIEAASAGSVQCRLQDIASVVALSTDLIRVGAINAVYNVVRYLEDGNYRGFADNMTPEGLKKFGFDPMAIAASGVDWKRICDEGFTVDEFKASGCPLAAAILAGYDVRALIFGYGDQAVIAAGCDTRNWILVPIPARNIILEFNSSTKLSLKPKRAKPKALSTLLVLMPSCNAFSSGS
jgi:hypothetical protein